MGNNGEQITWKTLEKIIFVDAKEKRYNSIFLSNEEDIDTVICENGDELRFGRKKSGNTPFFYLNRLSEDSNKGMILLDPDSLKGLSEAINEALANTISVQRQLVIDYPSLKDLWLALSVIQIGISSRIMFEVKNKTDGSTMIQLENLRINDVLCSKKLNSELIPHSKKHKEIWFTIEPISNEIKKLEMDVAVYSHIYEKPQVERKSIEVVVSSNNHSIKSRIVSKRIEAKVKIPFQKYSGDGISISKMKEQVVLFKRKSINNDVINFGKGKINNERYYFIKKVSDGIVTGGIILEGSALYGLSDILNNGIHTNKEDNKVFNGLKILNNDRVLVILAKVKTTNKIRLVFKVVNGTDGNIILELNNVQLNGVNTPLTLKSGLIYPSNKMQEYIFEFDSDKKCLQMSVVVKTHNHDKPLSIIKDIEIIMDENWEVKSAKILGETKADSNDKVTNSFQPQDSSAKPISLIDYRYFFVYTNIVNCKKLGHETHKESAVVGVARFRSGIPYIQQYRIPICRCDKCRAYFMSESVYNDLKSKGRFLPKLLSQREFNNKEYEGAEGSEHIMFKFGYSVRENGPGSKQRHMLLEQLIESDIVSKREAVNHIKGLIQRNRFKNNMGNAIKKWEDDIEYLTGKRLEIGVKAIVVSNDIINCGLDRYPC